MIAFPKLGHFLTMATGRNYEKGADMAVESDKEEANASSERPKIYVTNRGERYVKADELLRSERGRDRVKAMAALAAKQQSSANDQSPSQ